MPHAPVVLLHESVDLVISQSEIRTTLDGALDVIAAEKDTVIKVEQIAAILIPA